MKREKKAELEICSSDSNLHSHLYSEAGYLNSDSFSGFVGWNRFFLDLKMEKMTLVLNSRYSNT